MNAVSRAKKEKIQIEGEEEDEFDYEEEEEEEEDHEEHEDIQEEEEEIELNFQSRRRRTKNNLESIIDEISKEKDKVPKFEVKSSKVTLFGYYTYKLKKHWNEYVEKAREIETLVYLTYIYGLNLLHFMSGKMERMEKKGEIERISEISDSVLGYQKKTKEKVRDRLKPMGEEGKNKNKSSQISHRYKFRKSVKQWRQKKLFCKFCENSIKQNDHFLKCCSCECGFHKYCLERETQQKVDPSINSEAWRCNDCLVKISTRRLTRNFKKQMNIDFL